MISSATLQFQKMNANKHIANAIDDKNILEKAKGMVKQFLLGITAQKTLKNLDSQSKVDIFYHVLDHNTTQLKKALEKAKLVVVGLTTEELVSALLYSNNPRLDSMNLFTGYKIFTSTAEQFLFTLFDSADKKTFIKNVVTTIGSDLETNPIKLRTFINTYMNKAEMAHHNAMFFCSMYELGIRKFHNLTFYVSIIPENFSDIEFNNCKFGNVAFGFIQNIKFVNCNISSGTKFENLQDCLFVKCELDNIQIDTMTRTTFIDCIETHKVNKYTYGVVESYHVSRNAYNTLNDITFYREDSDYRGINVKLKPFILDQNKQMIENAVEAYSTFKPLLPGSICSSLKNTNCLFTYEQFSNLPNDAAIVIVVSNRPVLSGNSVHQYFFYTTEQFKEYLIRSYQDSGIDALVVPENKVKFYISPPDQVADQEQIYYTFYRT